MKNFFLTLCSLLIVFVLFEAGLRLTNYKALLSVNTLPKDYMKKDKEIGFDIAENFGVKKAFLTGDMYSYDVWSNELGCFDKPYEKKKSEDYVLLLGDSFTQYATEFDYKWGTQIEKILGKRVLKCGVRGFGTKQELIKGRRVVKKIGKSPSLIVVGWYWNDIEDDYLFPRRTTYDGLTVDKVDFQDIEKGTLKYRTEEEIQTIGKFWQKYCDTHDNFNYKRLRSFKCFLKRNVVTWNIFKEVIRNNETVRKTFFSKLMGSPRKPGSSIENLPRHPWFQEAISKNLDNIAELRNFSETQGANFLVVIIPKKEHVYSFMLPSEEQEYQDSVRKRMITFFNNQGINYLDLKEGFQKEADLSPRPWLDSKKDLYWKYDGHWNINGNMLAGKLVSKHIKENKLTSKAPKRVSSLD